MKRILCILLAVLLMAGCSAVPAPTEPAAENVSVFGEPQAWDSEGILEHIPMTVPDGWHLTGCMACRDGLLLWCVDSHLEGKAVLELCLIDGGDGTITARSQIETSAWATPQILGDRIFLCDSQGGTVTELGEDLQPLQHWSFDADGGLWYMGGSKYLYRYADATLSSTHIEMKAEQALMPEHQRVQITGLSGDQLTIDYMDDATGESRIALLDLNTGEIGEIPFEGTFGSADRLGDFWLCNYYMDGSLWYLGTAAEPQRIRLGDSSLRLLDQGYLLQTDYEGCTLRLYDLEGRFISACRLSETGTCYLVGDPMWCESRGGYYLQVQNFDTGSRLLFWDIEKSLEGEDLALESIPERSEAMQQLRQRADALEQAHGLSILLGDECQREFDTFTAEYAEDPEQIATALDTLEEALSGYPEGFLRQLRYGDMQSIQIQLVQTLRATDERKTGAYAAFTQDLWDHYLMVIDVTTSDTNTYYHEFSHIIDTCLIMNDSTFSEEEWAALNPAGFQYAYDYAAEWEREGMPEYFIDTYAMVNPTEDRARILEYAMMEGSEWTFRDHPGVKAKLEYYCKCIREYFDIPEREDVLWEQYL